MSKDVENKNTQEHSHGEQQHHHPATIMIALSHPP